MENEHNIDVSTFYNPKLFLGICRSSYTEKLSENDLLINDYYIEELRLNIPKFENFDMNKFTQMLTKVFEEFDYLEKIRAILMVFAMKNVINVTQLLGFIISEDKINYDIDEDRDDDELFVENSRYFTDIFFNELSNHKCLMLDVIETIHSFSSQYETSYLLMKNIITANENSLMPLPSDKLDFMTKKDVAKYKDKIFQICPIVLPFSVKYEKYSKTKTPDIKICIEFNREKPLETLWALSSVKNVNAGLLIDFINEPGIDCGGLTKEFIEISFKEIIKPKNNLFDFRNDFYWFKHHNYKNQEEKELFMKKYYCIGLLVGIVILNKFTIPFHFPPYLYKKLMHREITVSDFHCYDQELFYLYQKMISDDLSEESYIDYVYQDSLSKEEVDLVKFEVIDEDTYVPVPLTNENKGTFIRDVMKWIFDISIKDEFEAFEQGFLKVKNDPSLYTSFRLDEVDRIVSGLYKRDWSELKKSARYSGGYKSKSKTIELFWKYFDELNEDGKLNVLKFIRASTAIPPGGMKDIHITFKKVPGRGPPIAHTCFDTIDLPEYKTFEELKDKCDLGFAYSESFGFG